MENIEDLIRQFRSSGGKFDNLEVGYREDSGFYCYSPDKDRDSTVSCPASLLVDRDDIGVNQDGLFIANPDNYKKNMGLLEKYFAFHFNRKMLERYIEKKRQVDALSSRELSLISRIYPPGQFLSGSCGDLEYARMQILASHVFQYSGKKVIMPFVTFLNHAKNGRPFEANEQGITVSGKFNGEVFARYNMGDVITVADRYGFITDTRFAYSLPMAKSMPGGVRIVINRNPWESTISQDGFRQPLINKEHGAVVVSWFPLYFERGYYYPAKMARKVATEAGLPAEIFLHDVVRANLHELVTVAIQLRGSENRFAQLVASAAQRQLELISGIRG